MTEAGSGAKAGFPAPGGAAGSAEWLRAAVEALGLRPEEAAAALGIGRRTLQRYLAEGVPRRGAERRRILDAGERLRPAARPAAELALVAAKTGAKDGAAFDPVLLERILVGVLGRLQRMGASPAPAVVARAVTAAYRLVAAGGAGAEKDLEAVLEALMEGVGPVYGAPRDRLGEVGAPRSLQEPGTTLDR